MPPPPARCNGPQPAGPPRAAPWYSCSRHPWLPGETESGRHEQVQIALFLAPRGSSCATPARTHRMLWLCVTSPCALCRAWSIVGLTDSPSPAPRRSARRARWPGEDDFSLSRQQRQLARSRRRYSRTGHRYRGCLRRGPPAPASSSRPQSSSTARGPRGRLGHLLPCLVCEVSHERGGTTCIRPQRKPARSSSRHPPGPRSRRAAPAISSSAAVSGPTVFRVLSAKVGQKRPSS